MIRFEMCLLLVLALCSVARAETADARARRELQEDACAAAAAAEASRSLYRDYRDDHARQLCERYRDRYGDWPPKCCSWAKSESEREGNQRKCIEDYERTGSWAEQCWKAEEVYRAQQKPFWSDLNSTTITEEERAKRCRDFRKRFRRGVVPEACFPYVPE